MVGCGEYVNAMEVLDMAVGRHWTSLTFFLTSPSKRLHVGSMGGVFNQLFVAVLVMN